jgi:hypothetical protein
MTDAYLNYPEELCIKNGITIPKSADYKGTRLCDIIDKNFRYKMIVTYYDKDNNVVSYGTPGFPQNIANLKVAGFDDYWKYNLCEDPTGIVDCCDVCDFFTNENTIKGCMVASIVIGLSNPVAGAALQVGCGLAQAVCSGCLICVNYPLMLPYIPNESNFDCIITGFQFSLKPYDGINRLTDITYCPVLRTDNSFNQGEDKFKYYRSDAETDQKTYEGITAGKRLNISEDQTLGNYDGTVLVNIEPFRTEASKAYGLRGIAYQIQNSGTSRLFEIYFLFTSFYDGDSKVYRLNSNLPAPYYEILPENGFPSSGNWVIFKANSPKEFIRNVLCVGANYGNDKGGGFKGFWGAVFNNLTPIWDALQNPDYHKCCPFDAKDMWSIGSMESFNCYRNRYTVNTGGIEPILSPNCLNNWNGYCNQDKFNTDTEEKECRKFCTFSYTDCDKYIDGYCLEQFSRKKGLMNISNGFFSMVVYNGSLAQNISFTIPTGTNLDLSQVIQNLQNEYNKQKLTISTTPIKILFNVVENKQGFYCNIKVDIQKYTIDDSSNTFYFSLNQTTLAKSLGFTDFTLNKNVFMSGSNPITLNYSPLFRKVVSVEEGDNLHMQFNINGQIIDVITTFLSGLREPKSIIDLFMKDIKNKTGIDIFADFNNNIYSENNLFKLVSTPLSKKLGYEETQDFCDTLNTTKIQCSGIKPNTSKVTFQDKIIIDQNEIQKDKICGCYQDSYLQNIDDIDLLGTLDKQTISPYDAMRIYTDRKLNINSVRSLTNKDVDCLLPNCNSTLYKYTYQKQRTKECDPSLTCINQGNSLINYINENSGSKILCDECDETPGKYTPMVYFAPKGEISCLDLLKEKDIDCVVDTEISVRGKCGEYEPNKLKYEKKILQFPYGNGELCPPLRDRTTFTDCIPITDQNVNSSPKSYKVYFIIGGIIVLLLVILFLKKVVFT